MNKFVMGISDLVLNECRSSMLIHRMDISPFIVYVEHLEEENLKKDVRELKKVTTEKGNSSKSRLCMEDKPMFKRRFTNQILPNALRLKKSKVSSPNPQAGNVGGFYIEKPLCSKCCRKKLW